MLAQYILLAVTFIELSVYAFLHGSERKGKYNFITAFINAIFTLSLLYSGGFFNGLLNKQ